MHLYLLACRFIFSHYTKIPMGASCAHPSQILELVYKMSHDRSAKFIQRPEFTFGNGKQTSMCVENKI